MILGEEISGSEGSGTEEMDEGDDEGAEAGEGHRRRRGKKCVINAHRFKCAVEKMAENLLMQSFFM